MQDSCNKGKAAHRRYLFSANVAKAPLVFSALLYVEFLPSTAIAYDAPGIAREQPAAPAAPRQLTKAPELLKSVPATVPPDSLQPGTSAEVVFQIEIDENGKVVAANLTTSVSPELDEAARAAVLQMEFSPAEIDNKPGAVRVEYRYRFEGPPLPTPVMAQEKPEPPVNFKGRILERGSRDPLRGAVVFLPDQNLTASSDNEGNFEIRGVAPGKVRVQISEPKHRKYEVVEDVAENQVVELTAYLMRNIASGREIVVYGDREKKDVVKRVLHQEELKTVPGTLGDPLRVLQTMPGVARPMFISGALIIRGARPNDSKVYIDGVAVPLLYHLGAGPSVITPSFVDQINFYPGVFGAKYGNAIGGIVDVDTHIPKVTRTHGEIKVDMLDARFYSESPLGENSRYGTLTLAGRRSYIDAWLPSVLKAANQNGDGSVTAIPYYWDYQGRYSLSLTEQKRLEATVFGSNDVLKISRVGTIPAQDFTLNSQTGFHRMRLLWVSPLYEGWKWSIAPMIGLTPSTTDINALIKFNLTSYDAGLRTSFYKEYSNEFKLEFGAEANAARFKLRFETASYPTADNPNPAPSVREQAIDGATGAIYIEPIWSPWSRLKLIPGLRMEEYKLPGGSHHSVEPRIAVRHDISEEFTLKGGAGIHRQMPQPRFQDRVAGNPYLGLEQSDQVDVGAEYRPIPSVLLDIQTYYSRRHDLATSSRDIVYRDGAYVPENFNNSGKGRAYGLEVLAKHDLTERFYGWISYTWSRSEDVDKNTGQFAPSVYDQTHILGVVASYKFNHGWEVGARYRLTTGRPETPIVGATYDSDRNRYVPIYGEPGSTRGDTFSQLDLRVERLWTYDLWKLSIYLDVQNVFNSANPEGTLWDYRYGQSAPLRGLPILPVLGVRGEF